LMVLLVLVFLSGVVGAAIQHFVPSMVTSLVPLETIYEEIPHVREQLCAEADKLVRVLFTQPGISGTGAATDSEEMIELESEDREYVGNLYRQTILPFLRDPAGAGSVLADAGRSASFFEALRRKLPAPAHGVIADLESICEVDPATAPVRLAARLAFGARPSLYRTDFIGCCARWRGVAILKGGRACGVQNPQHNHRNEPFHPHIRRRNTFGKHRRNGCPIRFNPLMGMPFRSDLVNLLKRKHLLLVVFCWIQQKAARTVLHRSFSPNNRSREI
jgi:hypothetical protein